jgi:2-amino-4-hydroxy-6-hydroxymethyldihydropteridine diphosphokinase
VNTPSSSHERPLEYAFIALGSNVGDSPRIVAEATARLQQLSRRPLRKSSLWRSEPVGCPPGSPPFINAVVGLSPRLDETPDELLASLQALEREFGRHPKKVLNEPRPLDLDLVTFGAITCATPKLTLPHPRAHLRRFVLEPLAEIAPDLILPGQGKTVRQLLETLGLEQGVKPL